MLFMHFYVSWGKKLSSDIKNKILAPGFLVCSHLSGSGGPPATCMSVHVPIINEEQFQIEFTCVFFSTKQ